MTQAGNSRGRTGCILFFLIIPGHFIGNLGEASFYGLLESGGTILLGKFREEVGGVYL